MFEILPNHATWLSGLSPLDTARSNDALRQYQNACNAPTKNPAYPDPEPASTAPVLGTQIGGDHYTRQKIQPITYIWANDLGFSEGNVVKYVTRWKYKGGIADLKKARHHLDLLIEELESKEQHANQGN